MANMRDIDVSTLGMLCSTCAHPKVELKDHTELYSLVNQMTELMDLQAGFESLDSNRLDPALTTQLASLQKDPGCSPIFSKLDQLAGAMATHFLSIRDTLQRKIAPEVTALTEMVNQEMTKYLQIHGADSLLTADEQMKATPTMKVFKWNDHLRTHESTLLSYLKAGSNFAFSDGISRYGIGAAMSRIPSTIHELNLPVETEQGIVSQLMKQPSISSMDPELVGKIVRHACSADTYTIMRHHIRLAMQSTPMQACEHYLSLIQYAPVLDAMAATKFTLSDDTAALLKENLDGLKMCQYALEFYIRVQRREFSKSVVLSAEWLNGDTMDTFLAEQPEGGTSGTMEDITNYVKLFHVISKLEMPNYGITGDTILGKKEDVLMRLHAAESDLDRKRTFLRGEAMTYAFQKVLTNYLQNLDESRVPTHLSRLEFVNLQQSSIQHARSTLLSKNGCLEDSLYRFLIRCHYPDSMVAAAYEHYQDAAVILLDAQEGEVALEQLNKGEMDAIVGSRIMTEFLVKTFVA